MVGDCPFSVSLNPEYEVPLMVVACAYGLVLYTPFDSMYRVVAASMAWST